MALQGDLKDISVSDLIQYYCREQKTVELAITDGSKDAFLYFANGAVKHAHTGGWRGEEAVYDLLKWKSGRFTVKDGTVPPEETIERSWPSLLMEGVHRMDEEENQNNNGGSPMSGQKKGEQIAEALTNLLSASSDINGVAVVGVNGLVYSANIPQKSLNEGMVGAVSAAVLGLSRKSIGELKRGDFKQTLIQGEGGNIIVAPINEETLFVGLTAPNVNLGMAFAEARSMVARFKELL